MVPPEYLARGNGGNVTVATLYRSRNGIPAGSFTPLTTGGAAAASGRYGNAGPGGDQGPGGYSPGRPIDSSFASAHQRPRGRLRIDIGSANASCVLIPVLPEFIARYPGIRVDLGVNDRRVDLIGENVDCVVRGRNADELSLIAHPLGRAS
ncbi:LysR substrate-binding domain-containing protein [Paraburkholderia sp. SIMBA_054]|uniref:LysR substrate-binding domain-containing protein n=1 Tax=Paraburkholderia sp. SIMBA_054 TaxID=3085795 RepID=UPI00397E8D10